ncbi:MAG: SLC13/DASS family transporter [Thermoleophilia bacterium]|nr:SLC13/DASS family transporter [Thermoleophilia bacterium]
MSDSTIALLVLAATVALFMSGRVAPGAVAIGASLALVGTGILSVEQALAGFGDPVVVMIAALFVVAEGLDASGLTARLGGALERAGRGSSRRILLLVMLGVAGLTALINVNGAVAALLPVVVLAGARTDRPEVLLLPLAFAAHAGSLLTLTGTPVNLIIDEASRDAGAGGVAFFEFAYVGVPLLAGTMLIILLFGRRLIPRRSSASSASDLSDHLEELRRHYGLGDGPGTSDTDEFVTREHGLLELVVGPRSRYIADRAYPGMITDDGELVVLGVSRHGTSLDELTTTLEAGDVVLLRGAWDALARREDADAGDLLVVEESEAVRRQLAPLGTRSWATLFVVAAMVVLMAGGIVPAVVAALLAALTMSVGGLVSSQRALQAISWPTILLIAGMIPVTTALTQTGAAALVGGHVVDLVGDAGTHALLASLFLITAVLGQLISNTATALIMIPVGLSAAHDVGVDPQVVLMCLAIASAASFLTPIATPANMMVQQPAGLHFGDYWKLGVPLMAWFAAVAVFVTPIVW